MHEDFPPCPDDFNMAAHVLARARVDPNRVVLQQAGRAARRWTAGEIEDRVLRLATGLQSHGLQKNDRIFLRLGNHVETLFLYLAAIAVDIVPVPVSPQIPDVELARLMPMVGASLLFTNDDHTGLDVEQLALIDVEGLLAQTKADYTLGAARRLAYIVFTSGSGGQSRAVLHAHSAAWARQMLIKDWSRIGPEDKMMHFGDLNWTYTMGVGFIDPLIVGATAFLRPPDAAIEEIPDLIASNDITILATDPGVLRRLSRLDLPRLPKLRHVMCSGWALPENVAKSWTSASGTPVYEAIGQTEISSYMSQRPATGMRPQTGRRLAILDEAGNRCQSGETGELAVHRSDPGLMIGYAGVAPERMSCFQGEWYRTGDLFSKSETGDFVYKGRADDIINPGGYRVSPPEIEKTVASYPSISEAAAFELDVKRDTSILACVFVAARHVDHLDLKRHCAQTLATYKIPRLFVHVDQLPKNSNGKVIRNRLPDLVPFERRQA